MNNTCYITYENVGGGGGGGEDGIDKCVLEMFFLNIILALTVWTQCWEN